MADHLNIIQLSPRVHTKFGLIPFILQCCFSAGLIGMAVSIDNSLKCDFKCKGVTVYEENVCRRSYLSSVVLPNRDLYLTSYLVPVIYQGIIAIIIAYQLSYYKEHKCTMQGCWFHMDSLHRLTFGILVVLYLIFIIIYATWGKGILAMENYDCRDISGNVTTICTDSKFGERKNVYIWSIIFLCLFLLLTSAELIWLCRTNHRAESGESVCSRCRLFVKKLWITKEIMDNINAGLECKDGDDGKDRNNVVKAEEMQQSHASDEKDPLVPTQETVTPNNVAKAEEMQQSHASDEGYRLVPTQETQPQKNVAKAEVLQQSDASVPELDSCIKHLNYAAFTWLAEQLDPEHVNGNWLKLARSFGIPNKKIRFMEDGGKGHELFFETLRAGKPDITLTKIKEGLESLISNRKRNDVFFNINELRKTGKSVPDMQKPIGSFDDDEWRFVLEHIADRLVIGKGTLGNWKDLAGYFKFGTPGIENIKTKGKDSVHHSPTKALLDYLHGSHSDEPCELDLRKLVTNLRRMDRNDIANEFVRRICSKEFWEHRS